MIFMHGIVAMHNILADEIAKSQYDSDFLSWSEDINVLPALLMRGRLSTVSRKDAAFGRMDMHRMPPSTFAY